MASNSFTGTITDDFTQEVLSINDQIVTQVLKEVHSNSNINVSSIPHMEKYLENGDFQWSVIGSILSGDSLGRFYCKILNSICVVIGEQRSAEILSKMIFAARGEKQIASFLSFSMTVIQYFPNLMTTSVRHLMQNLDSIEIDFNNSQSTPKDIDPLDVGFITNLLTIIQWQQRADNDNMVKYIGLSLPDLRGEIQEFLLDWALSYANRIHSSENSQLNATSENTFNTFFTLLKIVTPRVQLQFSVLRRLLVSFGALIISLMNFIHVGTPVDGLDVVCRCFSVTGYFFTFQQGASKDLLVSAIIDEAFKNFKIFFGEKVADSFSSMFASRTVNVLPDFSFIPSEFLDPERKLGKEISCLRQLREMPIEVKSAAAVAHSGVLPRKANQSSKSVKQPPSDDSATVSNNVRRLLFVHFIEKLCIGPAGDHDPTTCKYLAEILVDYFAGDGATSFSGWNKWDHEKELTPKYIEVWNRMKDCPVLLDFIFIISDLGAKGLYLCLPLVKAPFAALLISLETSPLKMEPVSLENLQRTAQILSFFISARIYPKLLAVCFEIISQISNYEAFVLLLDFWKFIAFLLNDETVDFSSTSAEISYTYLLLKPPGSHLISSITLIIQRNIVKLGKYLPKFLSENGIEMNDQNEWACNQPQNSSENGS